MGDFYDGLGSFDEYKYISDEENNLAKLIYGSWENALDKYSEQEDRRFKEVRDSDPAIKIKEAKLRKLEKLIEVDRKEVDILKDKIHTNQSNRTQLRREINQIENELREKGKNDGK